MNRLLQIARALPWLAVFAAGFAIATWREESRADRNVERLDAAFRAQVQAQVDRFNAQSAASGKRENELAGELEAAKKDSESLRDEVETRPVVQQIVEKPVDGVCPAVPSVDWRMFQCFFDAAGAGRPAACSAEPGRDAVRRIAPAARY